MYTDEKNAQLVLALLKKSNIRKFVVSPGTTNMPIVGSVQRDPFFKVYSAVDERSAAYMACGLSQESGEPVVLSCTGATASRNYLPGLTEAYYRKIPIVALTSLNGDENIGNLTAQNIDRTVLPNDVANLSVKLPIVHDEKSKWYCNLLVNKALVALKRRGGGPVHINLPTTYSGSFNTKILPETRLIKHFESFNEFPIVPTNKKIAVFIGSHKNFSTIETKVLDEFVQQYNAVILSDHTSGYKGNYQINNVLATANISPTHKIARDLHPDIIIHIGEVSGDYPTFDFLLSSKAEVWRISRDGELKDTFKKLVRVYEIDEYTFFERANKLNINPVANTYLMKWKSYIGKIESKLPEFSFSNIWIASILSKTITKKSVINYGILNTLRSNNFFQVNMDISTSSNVGGFGIDGNLSTLIGSSLFDNNKLYYCILGDLAFFYDMNVLGNRHVGKNVRVLIINNGGGTEFKNYSHLGAKMGEEADDYVAAAGHFAQKDSEYSPAQAWSKSLGFDYISAHNKQDFYDNIDTFKSSSAEKPIVFECFTNFEVESENLKIISTLDDDVTYKGKIINTANKHLSEKTKSNIKQFLRR